MNTNLTFI